MKDYKYKVFCRCATFNHADYIKDALDGFCMQVTSFPYVCLIMDDASTDGEQEVIFRYMEEYFDVKDTSTVIERETDDYRLTFARHKSNRNCYFIALYLKYNHYSLRKDRTPYYDEWSRVSEYQAFCEGDDYWISPHKLSKQVEFLDNNPNYSAVFADIIIRNEKVNPPTEARNRREQNHYSLRDVYCGKVFPVNSTCVRNEVWNHQNEFATLKTNGDIKWSYMYAKFGYIYKMDEYFSVYRKTGKGLSSQWDARDQFIHDITEWYDFFRQIGFPDKTRHALFQSQLINNYIYGHGFNKFPYKEIKSSLFASRWYIYILTSIIYPFKRVKNSIIIRIRRVYGKG